MNTNEQPNQNETPTSSVPAQSPAQTSTATAPDPILAFSIQPLALPGDSPLARNAALRLADAYEKLAQQPSDIQEIIRPHVEKHYPLSDRFRQPIEFDRAKALCIHTRIFHETDLKQKRQSVVGDDVRSLTSSPQSEISNLKFPIPSHPPQNPRTSQPTASPNPTPHIPAKNPHSAPVTPQPIDVSRGISTSFPHNFSENEKRTPQTPPSTPTQLSPQSPVLATAPLPSPSSLASLPPPPLLKRRRDNLLANLPPADQEKLYLWLDTLALEDIVQKAAQPRDDGGLAIKTSIAALSRFNKNRALKQRLEDALDLLEFIQTANADIDVASQPSAPASPEHSRPNLASALQQLHDAQLLESAAEALEPSDLRYLGRYLNRVKDQEIRHRALDLHQKRLAFHMQKTGFDLTEEALRRLPELNEIAADKKLTFEERFNKSFAKIMGMQVEDLVGNANKKYKQNYPDAADHDPKPDLTCLNEKIDEREIVNQLFAMPAAAPAKKSPPTTFTYEDEN